MRGGGWDGAQCCASKDQRSLIACALLRISFSSQGDRSVFKVVYVVLESQYQSSLTAACKRINAGQPDVAVEVSRQWGLPSE